MSFVLIAFFPPNKTNTPFEMESVIVVNQGDLQCEKEAYNKYSILATSNIGVPRPRRHIVKGRINWAEYDAT